MHGLHAVGGIAFMSLCGEDLRLSLEALRAEVPETREAGNRES